MILETVFVVLCARNLLKIITQSVLTNKISKT
jgi:hypothetical protein